MNFSWLFMSLSFCSLLLIPHKSNLKLTQHPARAFDLPATETWPGGGCCSVCYRGIGRRMKGGKESQPFVSSFFTGVSQLCELVCALHSPVWIFLLCRIDPYGFERHHDFEPYTEMMNEYIAVLNRRSTRWSKLLQEKPHIEKNVTGKRHTSKHTHAVVVFCWLCGVIMKSVSEVKRYVRKGVPNEHRARIWMAASGAQERLEGNPGYYHSLLTMEHDTKLKETIHTGETTTSFQPKTVSSCTRRYDESSKFSFFGRYAQDFSWQHPIQKQNWAESAEGSVQCAAGLWTP